MMSPWAGLPSIQKPHSSARHVGLGGLEHGRVVALAVEVGADPARQVPVDVLVGRVELRALQVLGEAEARRPRRDSLP